MVTLMVILFFLLLVVIVGAILNSISSILGVIFVICIGIFIFLMIIGLIVNFFTATKEERRAYEVKREVKKLKRNGRKAEARLIEQNEMLLNREKSNRK